MNRWSWGLALLLLPAAMGQVDGAIALSDFELYRSIGQLAAPGYAGDFSGVAYVDRGNGNGRLFVVDNRTTNVYEFTTDGDYRRTIAGINFWDTEGIVYLGDDQFAIVEEQSADINIVTIASDTTWINKNGAVVVRPYLASNGSSLNPGGGNKGIEGIAYDADRGVFYVVKEKYPCALRGAAVR